MIYKHLKTKTFMFLMPGFFLILLFYLIPSAISIFYSFTDKALVGVKSVNWNFIGLDNYITMFTDASFGISLFNTIIFLIFSAILGQQILGFYFATLMQKSSFSVRRISGLAVLLGWVTPEVVVSVLFYAFLNEKGSVNTLLGFIGIKPIAWLYNYAMISVIIANIWRGTAFSMLMFQSALGNVDSEVIEAAKIDGAHRFQILVKITIPIISGSILTNTILITLQTLGMFGLIYTLTGGGPSFKTTTLPIYMYNKAFSSYQIGYGTAMAIILLLFGIILSVFYTKSFKQKI